ncbi:MAG: fatty acid desaturase [Cytophagales bacterium]|nr:fatty acid desaturase [Cytophagales bacterium]
MSAAPEDFLFSQDPEPHRSRTKEIIKKHPEIRELIGRNPNTIYVILFCVALMIAVGYLVSAQPWWVVFLAAYFIGAFANHTLFICIHEVAHNLIFKSKEANLVAGIIANLPQIVPSAVSFQKYHLKHHVFQGVPELDGDLPYKWEARLFHNSTIGKALWLLFYPVFQAFRPLRLTKEIQIFDTWTIINWVANFTFTALVIYFLGIKAFVFMLASLFFSIGLHPLGARWIQEHYLTSVPQETYSYYGPLNVPNLNVGHHNEHHDFPSVPWHNLPKIRKIASEYYDTLAYHTSYTKLLFRFLFDNSLSVFSRTIRENRGKVPLNDNAKPDEQLVKAM